MSSTRQKTLTSKAWEEILTKIIGSAEFTSQIQTRSYFLSPEYISFKKYIQSEFNMVATTNTANFLSKDFWHQQSRTLRDSGYYLIRTGRGSFAILVESKFPRPYLQLNIENAIELRSSDNPYSSNLEQAFYSKKQENAALEQLRFTGIYDIVLKELFGSNYKYHTGIRGNRNEEFDIYFHRVDSSIPEKIRKYKGQAELDYTIWTKDSVLLFEAKQIDDTNVTRYLDIGWHKFPLLQ